MRQQHKDLGINQWYKIDGTPSAKQAINGNINLTYVIATEEAGGDLSTIWYSSEYAVDATKRAYINASCVTPEDVIPPEINQDSYNMTSEGGIGCTNWRTDKNDACTTSDTTPTVKFTTIQSAFCGIGISNNNHTNMGISRNCTGGGSASFTCTLTPQDEITNETSFLYIGCKDAANNENRTSTSGALRISIHTSDLESIGRGAIESGIQNALGSGYTIYTDQKIYARNAANQQAVGVFDKVVKWMNKVWAFNALTGNYTAVGMFNITPVLYTLEFQNSTNSTVNNTVYQLIMATK